MACTAGKANMLQALQRDGLFLSNDGLDACVKAVGSVQSKIFKHVVDTRDLKKVCGAGALPEDVVSGKASQLVGPIVLQVGAVSNIRQPTTKQRNSPRMLCLKLTDGRVKLRGLEHGDLKSDISVDTPPGTKLLIRNCRIRGGFLLLNGHCVQVLGGNVMNLVSSWRAARELKASARMQLKKGEEPPPPFSVSKPLAKVAGAGGRGMKSASKRQAKPPNASCAGAEDDADALSDAAVARFRAIFGTGKGGGSKVPSEAKARDELVGDGGMVSRFAAAQRLTASDDRDRVGYEDFLAERQRDGEFEVSGTAASRGKGKSRGSGVGIGTGRDRDRHKDKDTDAHNRNGRAHDRRAGTQDSHVHMSSHSAGKDGKVRTVSATVASGSRLQANAQSYVPQHPHQAPTPAKTSVPQHRDFSDGTSGGSTRDRNHQTADAGSGGLGAGASTGSVDCTIVSLQLHQHLLDDAKALDTDSAEPNLNFVLRDRNDREMTAIAGLQLRDFLLGVDGSSDSGLSALMRHKRGRQYVQERVELVGGQLKGKFMQVELDLSQVPPMLVNLAPPSSEPPPPPATAPAPQSAHAHASTPGSSARKHSSRHHSLKRQPQQPPKQPPKNQGCDQKTTGHQKRPDSGLSGKAQAKTKRKVKAKSKLHEVSATKTGSGNGRDSGKDNLAEAEKQALKKREASKHAKARLQELRAKMAAQQQSAKEQT